MAQLDITLDGNPQQIEPGTTGTALYEGRREIVALRIDGELRDLDTTLEAGQCVEGVEISSPDGLQILIDAGVTAVVQPGGSIRDEEVIAAAEEAGITMYLTGSRHFFH